MAKRTIDTGLFRRAWFRALQPKYKALWLYLVLESDNAGVWHVDEAAAAFHVGAADCFELDLPEALRLYAGRVVAFDSGEKWLLVDLVRYQCGVLKPSNNYHASVLALCEKYKEKYDNRIFPDGWPSVYSGAGQGLARGTAGAISKSKSNSKSTKNRAAFVPPSALQVQAYLDERQVTAFDGEHFVAHYEANGWRQGNGLPLRSWKAAAITWTKNGKRYSSATAENEKRGAGGIEFRTAAN